MSSNKPTLKLDWCSHEAAKYAVLNWHYSKRMPVGKLVKIGVWEDKKFIGTVIFAMGSNRHIGNKFGLDQFEICELVRVALTKHKTEVTRIISIALKMLHNLCPGLRAVISYADPEQGHSGGIYRGGNWIYLGHSASSKVYVLNGKEYHSRTANPCNQHFGVKRPPGIENATIRYTEPKHKFIWLFDKSICVSSIDVDAPVYQTGEGGSIPTDTLHIPTVNKTRQVVGV